MLLAIDIGNTRIKWGLHDGRGWLQCLHTSNGLAGIVAELAADPHQLIISNVGDPCLTTDIFRYFNNIRQHVVQAQAQQCGVRNGYQTPQQLGSDRWAAILGAYKLGASTVVVVNAGTALTVDALYAGEFLGGSIGPGYQLMRDSLAQRVGLPLGDAAHMCEFATNTVDALSSGCINAMLGSVQRMQSSLASLSRSQPEIWLTGGDAPRLLPHLSARLEHHLVLEGLYHIALEIFA